jgi:hypothetical protein
MLDFIGTSIKELSKKEISFGNFPEAKHRQLVAFSQLILSQLLELIASKTEEGKIRDYIFESSYQSTGCIITGWIPGRQEQRLCLHLRRFRAYHPSQRFAADPIHLQSNSESFDGLLKQHCYRLVVHYGIQKRL